jgi:UDP-arabinose 4-epimerase
MTARANILVTGGAGYIGSHACKALAAAGHNPVTLDNFSTGNRDAVKWGAVVDGDIRDTALVSEILSRYRISAVIHFAAKAYVGESVGDPAIYYSNNVGGTISILHACRKAGIRNFVFSSSCATYGIPDTLPITESTPQNPLSPYGWTKLMGEQMIRDHGAAYGMGHVILRYFNAAGADPSGELAERHDPETHLIPLALRAAFGGSDKLQVFGTDYPTPDGTCIRDYVHVSDLARAHTSALAHLLAGGRDLAVNIGSGRGHSILEIVDQIQRQTGRRVPLVLSPRRPGDPPVMIADARSAQRELGFVTTQSDLATIVTDAARHVRIGAAHVSHA